MNDAIVLTDVRFSWRRDGPEILDVPHLSIRRGERAFISGPSGSGKSSLLNLIGGLVLPSQGRIEVSGIDICRLGGAARDSFRADRMGFIFQMFNLVPYLSLVDNVLLPCRFSSARRTRALERGPTLDAEARRLLSTMRLDADTVGDRSVSQLSVGQQQRVAAARALIGAPEIVIADEPTSALDAAARDGFLDLLIGETDTAGSTLVFVSHDESLGPRFDSRLRLSSLNRASREENVQP